MLTIQPLNNNWKMVKFNNTLDLNDYLLQWILQITPWCELKPCGTLRSL